MVAQSRRTALPKRKRRWFQFGLRTLLVAMLVVSLALGWLARQLQEARGREAIVTELDMVGVYVYQYEPTAFGRFLREASPSLDDWLRTRLGDSLLSSPSAVSADTIRDDKIEYLTERLRRFPALRRVHLGSLSGESEVHIRAALPMVAVETPSGLGY